MGSDRERKKGADWRLLRGTARRRCGQVTGTRTAGRSGAATGAAGPLQGADRVGQAKKKSRASGPARVDQVGMSGCSVLAPTGHCGQTSQTGAEKEHGGGFGDGMICLPIMRWGIIYNVLPSQFSQVICIQVNMQTIIV